MKPCDAIVVRKPRVACGVERTAAVAPNQDRQRIARGERVEIRRVKDEEAGRAEGSFRLDLVGPRLRERRAFQGQCPRDHFGRDAGRLREAHAGERKQRNGCRSYGCLGHDEVSPGIELLYRTSSPRGCGDRKGSGEAKRAVFGVAAWRLWRLAPVSLSPQKRRRDLRPLRATRRSPRASRGRARRRASTRRPSDRDSA